LTKALVVMIIVTTLLLNVAGSMIYMVNAQDVQGAFFTLNLDCEPRRERFATNLAQALSQIGINVVVHVGEMQSIYARVRAPGLLSYDQGGWDTYLEGSTPPIIDPHATLTYPQSYVRSLDWTDRSFEDEIYAASMETNDTLRTQKYSSIQSRWLDLMPYIPVYYEQYAVIFNKAVQNTEAWRRYYITTVGDRSGMICRSTYDSTGGVYVPNVDTLVISEPNAIPTGLSVFGFSWAEGRFLRLVRLDPDGSIKPEIAQSWNISQDGLTYTFHLRPDIMWSDGVTLTAHEVLWTYDVQKDPAIASLNYKDLNNWVQSMEAPDNTTFIMHLKQPVAMLLNYFAAYYAWQIAPAHVLESVPRADLRKSDYQTKPWTVPVDGWIKIQEEVYGDHDLFVRNDNLTTKYFTPIRNKYILFKVVPDIQAALVATEKGEVHIPSLYYEFHNQYPTIIADSNLKVENVTSTTVAQLRVNPKNPLLGDSLVRKAVAYAIPVENYISQLNYGFGVFTSVPVHPNTPYKDHTLESQYYHYDIPKAKQLMEQAGYKYDYLKTPESPMPLIAAASVGGLAIGALASFGVSRFVHARAKKK
jgi:ABC-type transport system substrate-binding protein